MIDLNATRMLCLQLRKDENDWMKKCVDSEIGVFNLAVTLAILSHLNC